MRDYIGAPAEDLSRLMETARDVFEAGGYRGISTPVLEDARLFDRSLGEESDVVSEEMYTVEQSGDRSIALRPENTAGVVRSLIEHGLMSQANQRKFYYTGPMFRHERPQSGRQRQFHQVGLEVFGRQDPTVDAEVLERAVAFLEGAGVEDWTLQLNSIGCSICRPPFLERLTEALEPVRSDLCDDCFHRFETNPLRMLDCKESSCQQLYDEHAPSILDHLCDECDRHFSQLRDMLEELGIDFVVEPRLVRGLDYYVRTTFEFVCSELGSQDAVLAGGRYDGLVEELGGDPTPGIGFAAGVERLMILRGTLDRRDLDVRTDVFLIPFNDRCRDELLVWARRLRSVTVGGRRVRVELGDPEDSMRSQLRRSDRYGARVTAILGPDERESGTIGLKRMDTGEQITVERDPESDLNDRVVSWLQEIEREDDRDS